MERIDKSSLQHILPNLRTPRGFAILLSSYLVVGFLLMFSTTLLMLSTLDASQAQRSLTLSQAFWAAEAELEGAIMQLRTTPPPTLSNAACQNNYSGRTLSQQPAISSSSQLCGTASPQTYQINSTGVANTTNQLLSVVVEVAPRQTLRFDHLGYGTARAYVQSGTITGSMDTGLSRLVVLSSIRDTEGDVAVPQNTPRDGWARIKIRNNGTCQGDAWVKTGTDLNLNSWSSGIWVDGTSTLTGQRKYLSGDVTLPPIETPSNAISLGTLNLNPHEKRCLSAGTYVVERLLIGIGSELCTMGTVELYVDMKGAGDTPIFIREGSKLYGQPEGAAAFSGQNSPKDLRIFVKNDNPGNQHFVLFQGALAAAVVYAPDSEVQFSPVPGADPNPVFLGGIIASDVMFGEWETSVTKYAIYDTALKGLDIPINGRASGGASDAVTIKMWGTTDPTQSSGSTQSPAPGSTPKKKSK